MAEHAPRTTLHNTTQHTVPPHMPSLPRYPLLTRIIAFTRVFRIELRGDGRRFIDQPISAFDANKQDTTTHTLGYQLLMTGDNGDSSREKCSNVLCCRPYLTEAVAYNENLFSKPIKNMCSRSEGFSKRSSVGIYQSECTNAQPEEGRGRTSFYS